MSNYRIETKCVQEGWQPQNGEPRILPIIQSTTYKYESSQQMGDLFDLKANGYFYTRLANPTNDFTAKRLCELEGGVGAILTSSGQAASFFSIVNIVEAGQHVVCSNAVYGGTFNLFSNSLSKLGIEFTFVPVDCTEEQLNAAFKENTRAVFCETIANPALDICDIEMFARVAHANGVPLIVDNTFATPINCRPIEFGADIVIHSTSKYLDGHASAIGGAIVDSGNFDWNNGKYPMLTTPDESYHGVTYTEQFGKAAYITKCTTHLMRDYGSIPAPQNSFLLNLGMETLHLRMARHCENAQKVAEYLQQSDKIEWVNYAGLPDNKYYELAKKMMPNGTCGVVSFGIKGGREKCIKFMDSLKMCAIVTHVADVRTCLLHPASTTHRQMTAQQLLDAKVPENLIRLSVGIENYQDIIDDIEQALAQI